MTRVASFSNPLLLGFGTMEKTLERLAKSGDGYPPYNIERIRNHQHNDTLRMTLAVAGFGFDELEVTVDNGQLIIRGAQTDEQEHEYLHRGIAARQFQRVFMLADGMKVAAAKLKNGLLAIDLERPQSDQCVKHVEISVADR